MREISEQLGVSHQRVHQIVSDALRRIGAMLTPLGATPDAIRDALG